MQELTKDWQRFDVKDPFNENWVEGFISRHSGDDYGALMISKVNGDKAPQLIYCTPKIAYPFDRQGDWHWPKAKVIERYEKLDGTNIFAFRYSDAKGKEYLSYKTRLMPFLQDSRFGPFQDMWKAMLKKIPLIEKLPWLLGMNLSWELWGARNPHLVKYEVPLDVSLLFARQGQSIYPPSQLNHGAVPVLQVPLRGRVDRDYVLNYEQAKGELQAGLRELEDGYAGMEGEVWYLLDERGNWILFKCKPETIELIHWSAGGIGRNVIMATIENAFENWDEPTVEQVKELLREEFEEPVVEKAHFSIVKHLAEAMAKYEFQEKVLQAYRSLGMNILEDKRGVMRALSDQFARAEMGKVYAVIWAHTVK